MKTINHSIIFFGASLLLLAGCTSDEQSDVEGLMPISLTATVDDVAATRAGTAVNNAFASGDAFTAYFPTNVRVGNTTSASSTLFSYNGTTWSPTTQPYFNAGTTSATVHAYYGKSGGSSGTQVTSSTSSFSVAADQSTDANYKASDLMYATTTVQKASPSASLTFSHKMAKIIVTATAGSGVSQIQAVRIIGGHRTINISTPLSCTLGTTLSDANSTSSYITMYSGGSTSSASCAALVVPEASGFTGDFLQIVTDQGTVTYSLSSKVLASGQSYTFNITINAAAIGSTVSITGWSANGNATVNPTTTVETLFPGALSGKFTIDASGHKVNFSQGNLQATYNGSSWSWAFATNQWDYIGNAAGNTSINGNGTVSASNVTVDLFGWVGTSSTTLTSAPAVYGISNSTTSSHYGSSASDFLKSDWGNLPITNGGGAAGSGWRTLSKGQWTYVFNTRSTTSGVKYAKATVNSVSGVILLPDDWNTSYHTLASTNTANAAFTANSISSSEWTSDFASHGAVFLPAAGYRTGATVYYAGKHGLYWSSSPNALNAYDAYGVNFLSDSLNPASSIDFRTYGYSVRLVRQVE